MKRFTVVCVALLLCLSAVAQTRYPNATYSGPPRPGTRYKVVPGSTTIDSLVTVNAFSTGAPLVNVPFTVPSGTSPVLVAGASYYANTLDSVKYGSVKLTVDTVAASGDFKLALTHLVNPTAGADTIHFYFSGNTETSVGAVVFSNVHQTTPILNIAAAVGESTEPAVTVSSATNDLGLALNSRAWGTYTVGAGETLLFEFKDGSSNMDIACMSKAGAASVAFAGTMSISSTWVMIGASIKHK